MKFCTNCGKELTDDAVFCTACGTSTDSTPYTNATNPPNSSNTIMSNQPGTPGSQSAGYYQGGAQGAPGTVYSQPSAQGTPAGYYQPGGPNYPGGGPRKNNKPLIVVVSVIIGLCLIGGGIFAIAKLANKDNDTNVSDNRPTDNNSDTTASASAEPSIDNAPEDTNSGNESGSADFSMFDDATQENITAACEETGIDISKIRDLEGYGTWYYGTVYTFTYDDAVIDLLLYDDGTVFSLETGGVQVYLTGYSSYSIEDYMGYTTHFDESYPDNGYVFYQEGQEMNSTVTFESLDDYDYVVELVDQSTGALALALFVQAGSSMPIDVPAGDYIIQYAAGTDWENVDYLFGDATVIYRSDSSYSFSPENESTITLDITGGSGIAATEITIEEF